MDVSLWDDCFHVFPNAAISSLDLKSTVGADTLVLLHVLMVCSSTLLTFQILLLPLNAKTV